MYKDDIVVQVVTNRVPWAFKKVFVLAQDPLAMIRNNLQAESQAICVRHLWGKLVFLWHHPFQSPLLETPKRVPKLLVYQNFGNANLVTKCLSTILVPLNTPPSKTATWWISSLIFYWIGPKTELRTLSAKIANKPSQTCERTELWTNGRFWTRTCCPEIIGCDALWSAKEPPKRAPKIADAPKLLVLKVPRTRDLASQRFWYPLRVVDSPGGTWQKDTPKVVRNSCTSC